MALKDEMAARMTLPQKLAAWVLWRWLKEDGVDFVGQLISNTFAQKGWQTSIPGVLMLTLAAFVTFYCATDAKTGGWIDPHCAFYVQLGMYLSGIGHILAPGFTAAIKKE